MPIRLQVQNGPAAAEKLNSARGTVKVGRAEGADLVIDDDLLSRFHFTLECGIVKCGIRELGNRNETLVSKERTSAAEQLLHD